MGNPLPGLPHYVSLLLLSPKAIDQLLGAPYWESLLIPLLLLSNRDPLRWARGWGRPAAASLRWEGKFHGPFRRQGPLREKLVPNSVVDSCHASPVRDAVLSPLLTTAQRFYGIGVVPQGFAPLSPFGGRGVFVLGRKGQADAHSKGNSRHSLPLQGIHRHVRRTGLLQMGFFLVAQMLLQPLIML